MNASRLLLISLVILPSTLMAQKKEDLISIQRDVAQLEDEVRQMQKALDDKMAALTALVQQSIDASSKTAASTTALEHNVSQQLADQQNKLGAPLATLGSKMDDMTNDFRSVRENVAELVRHMNELDGKVGDISNAVRTMASSAVAPPPPANPTGGDTPPGTAQPAPDGPPAGVSEALTYDAAYRDYMGKKDNLAQDEFAQYLKYFPQSENAPNAQFYIAQIYFRGEDWVDAAKAFDAVLEKFPANPKTQEAQYMKAVSLMNAKEKTKAAEEFRSFLAKYPDNAHVKQAHRYLRDLGLERTPGRSKD